MTQETYRVERKGDDKDDKKEELMSCVMNLELDINSRPSTLLNQMA